MFVKVFFGIPSGCLLCLVAILCVEGCRLGVSGCGIFLIFGNLLLGVYWRGLCLIYFYFYPQPQSSHEGGGQ